MSIIYVGPTSAGSADGTSWANRYGSLNAAEDRPVQAGDTVYVGPGTYRELLTCDVNGSSGSLITYIGDYTGANTDGVGGVVRITGSDNDQTAARTYCINCNSKTYRKFDGFTLDTTTNNNLLFNFGGYGIVNKCYFMNSNGIFINAVGTNHTITNSLFVGAGVNKNGIQFTGTSDTSMNSVVENCMFLGGKASIYLYETIDVTIKNCTFIAPSFAVLSETAVVGTNYLYNCILLNTTLQMQAAGQLTEDYNNVWGITRTNVNAGANDVSYPTLLDSRWFFEAVNGGKMVTPFDLASYSGLINVAGTSPTTADMRGTTVQGTQREWGALEYDSSLTIEAGTGGGGIRNVPIPVFLHRRNK